MRAIVFGVILSLTALVAGRAFAISCDAAIERAKGKLVACECNDIAKNRPAAIPTCQEKLQRACMRAGFHSACTVQTESCNTAQAECEGFVTNHCVGSPSGAFLE